MVRPESNRAEQQGAQNETFAVHHVGGIQDAKTQSCAQFGQNSESVHPSFRPGRMRLWSHDLPRSFLSHSSESLKLTCVFNVFCAGSELLEARAKEFSQSSRLECLTVTEL